MLLAMQAAAWSCWGVMWRMDSAMLRAMLGEMPVSLDICSSCSAVASGQAAGDKTA